MQSAENPNNLPPGQVLNNPPQGPPVAGVGQPPPPAEAVLPITGADLTVFLVAGAALVAIGRRLVRRA